METTQTTAINFDVLLCPKPFTANIISPAVGNVWNEVDGIIPADKRFCDLAQNIIDSFDEHIHLRKARILLLVRHSDSDKKKLEAGTKISVGHAKKMNCKLRALMASLCSVSLTAKSKIKSQTADFVVTLSGDWLDGVGALCEGKELEDCEGVRKAAALIDHELSHCSAVIAGKTVSEEGAAIEIESLSDAFLERCDGVAGPGNVFIRYYKLKNGRYQWKMRKHDLEEFTGVVKRHGPWDKTLRKLVDVIEEWTPEEKKLFT